jgi:hypothetical protein
VTQELEARPYKEPDQEYRRGVEDLMQAAEKAREALTVGARNPNGLGVHTVRSFVAYLREQAEQLKRKSHGQEGPGESFRIPRSSE